MIRRASGVQLRPVDLTDIHILVVDDNDDTLEVLGTALQQVGAYVLKARSARDALTIIKYHGLREVRGRWRVEQGGDPEVRLAI